MESAKRVSALGISFIWRGAILLPLVVFVLFCQGCLTQSVSHSQTDAVSTSPVSSQIAQSTGYQTAKARFLRHDYKGALVALDALLAQPGQTDADRAFLRRQRTICQEAISGHPVGIIKAVTVKNSSVASAASVDCGPRALLLLCQASNPIISASLPALCKTADVTAPRGASLEGMTKAAMSVGFTAEAVQMDRDALANLSNPAIAWVDGNHYIAVYRVHRSLRGIDYDTATIQDPNKPAKEDITLTQLLSRSGGVLMTLTPPTTTATAQK